MNLPRSPRVSLLAGLTAAAFVSTVAPSVRADVASWVFLGAGWSHVQETRVGEGSDYSALLFNAGFGTSPAAPWIVGGVFQGGANFGFGSEWGGAFRVTTGGYSRGTWGLAFDVGPQYRVGEHAGAIGSTRLSLGGPWGLVLNGGASYGADEVATFTVALGLDFARLTVHRSSGLNWFPNPFPSPSREDHPLPHQDARAPSVFRW